MNKRITISIILLAVLAILGATIWNYTEPKTFAYEINPITFEVRSVEYLDRPITGMSEHNVLHQEQMAIGSWLMDNGYLKKQKSGYWTLLKSYNPRWGFQKGAGRELQQVFDVSGGITPMPHPDVDSPNQRWVDWCNKYPKRAEFVWNKYAELSADLKGLGCAGDMLWFAINFSKEIGDDEEFKAIIERRMLDCGL